jgi:NAD(P)-dependent dehydrogenase (short-subunit alcohol dehydrogenase family)
MPIRALDEPAHVLVTGASRGIGLAMVEQLLQCPDVARVLAVARSANVTPALSALAAQHPERLSRIEADLTDTADIERLARSVASTSPRLHLLLNCAGVLHDAELRPEKSLAQLSLDSLQRSFALNAFAPILLVQALLPRLRHGKAAVIASLSARVASIGDNRLGGWYAYRAAKAAQNQLLRTLSIELRRLNPQACCLLLHPGTVDTALSAPFNAHVAADRLFTPAHSAACLLAIVAQAGPADSGRFIAWDGQDIPW